MTADRLLRVHVLIATLGGGGAQALLADLAGVAPGAGIELSVAYFRDRTAAAPRLREAGVDPVRLPIRGMLSPRDRGRVRAHLAERAPDVLHTHLGTADVLGGLAAGRLGLPAVSTLHQAEWLRGGPRDRLKDRLAARVRRRNQRLVIAVSEAARTNYLAHGWEDPDRVVTVHSGIRDAPRHGEGAGVRDELGIGRDDYVVAMVSSHRPGKAHALAFEAAARLRERLPSLRMVVMGDGPARAEVEALARPLGNGAILTGFRDDVLRVLDGCDLVLHPSRMEALPTALIEAMAASCPVLATRVGGIPEIVDEGRTGILVDPATDAAGLAEAMGRLLDDAELRQRLGAEGRRRFAAHFTARQWVERLLAAYERAISSPRVRG